MSNEFSLPEKAKSTLNTHAKVLNCMSLSLYVCIFSTFGSGVQGIGGALCCFTSSFRLRPFGPNTNMNFLAAACHAQERSFLIIFLNRNALNIFIELSVSIEGNKPRALFLLFFFRIENFSSLLHGVSLRFFDFCLCE